MFKLLAITKANNHLKRQVQYVTNQYVIKYSLRRFKCLGWACRFDLKLLVIP